MITMYFAPPGIGKTSLAARFAWWNHFLKRFGLNKYDRVYANFELKYTYEFDKNDIGVYDFSLNPDGSRSNVLVQLDEAGCDFHARRFKDMSDQQISHFKKHRKYHEDFYVYSQSFDIDKVIRDLTPRLYYLKRCTIWPNTIKALRIKKSMIVDQESHQMLDGFEFDPWYMRPFTTKRYYLPPYWDMFDSWDAEPLHKKDFLYHGSDNAKGNKAN